MKKVMMMVAACMMASLVQAGVVKWSVVQIKPSGTAVSGAYAYIFEGSSPVSAATVSAAIEGGTISTLLGSALDSNGPSSTAGAITTKTAPGTYVSVSKTFYVVVFDSLYSTANGGKFAVSTAVTKSFGTSGDQTYAFNVSTASWTTYEAVPEPTSMALLAIGGAVFGLRRKFRK